MTSRLVIPFLCLTTPSVVAFLVKHQSNLSVFTFQNSVGIRHRL